MQTDHAINWLIQYGNTVSHLTIKQVQSPINLKMHPHKWNTALLHPHKWLKTRQRHIWFQVYLEKWIFISGKHISFGWNGNWLCKSEKYGTINYLRGSLSDEMRHQSERQILNGLHLIVLELMQGGKKWAISNWSGLAGWSVLPWQKTSSLIILVSSPAVANMSGCKQNIRGEHCLPMMPYVPMWACDTSVSPDAASVSLSEQSANKKE